MENLHPASCKLLSKICDIYNATNKTEISEFEITSLSNADTYFNQLSNYDYLTYFNTVAPYVKIHQKTIELAKTLAKK